MPKRMNSHTQLALIKAYLEWRPRSGVSAEQLAEAHGATKCSMYAMLRREGVPLKTGGRPPSLPSAPDGLAKRMATLLLDQLIDMKIEIRTLEQELQQLATAAG